MTDLTTDQRVALLLMDLLPQVNQYQNAAETNAEALAAYPAAAQVQRHIATRYDQIGDRLADVIEALAAGTLVIGPVNQPGPTVWKWDDEVKMGYLDLSAVTHAPGEIDHTGTLTGGGRDLLNVDYDAAGNVLGVEVFG